MVDQEYIKRVEKACQELLQEGENQVRAGKIAEKAGVDSSSRLGMQLTFRVLDFKDIEYDTIRHDDDSVSNEYRFY